MMNKEELKQYEISEEAIYIQCPECNQWSSVRDWESDVVLFGDGNEIVAMQCPKCNDTFERYTGIVFNWK